MKTRIEELVQKYWEAETTLEEEKELKALLTESKGYEEEKSWFGILNEYQRLKPKSVKIPDQRSTRRIQLQWLGWAASVAILASTWGLWERYQTQKQEELAYQEVMEALALIQNNLSKGQQHMEPLQDLKYLNTTDQLFQTNPAR